MNGRFYDIVLNPLEKMQLSKLREDLLSSAHGKTLEIGAGTGLNFSHYPEDAFVIAIDNDESMMSPAKSRTRGRIELRTADAEELPFSDNEFDSVAATLVFCTIPDPDKALKEVYRVLKPGGAFLLLEHIRRDTPIAGKVLDVMTPLWKRAAGGCHLNRNPAKQIVALGFEEVSSKDLWKGLGKMWHLRKPLIEKA